ncbi:MAG: methyltransferase domain-containing protein, partial [Propionibacteriaceae bacterium]|jgi:SAM-dependent methyltransferase|nr:methyltransferase domain-containing protein [Propionibacteriaceae bacterium]
LARIFGSALKGQSPSRPELVGRPLPLDIRVPTAGGGEALARTCFEPLGWRVETGPAPADAAGDYVDLRLRGDCTVRRALEQLYLILPALDDAKHYWVGEQEADKLVRFGGDWLPTHPARDLIVARYLAHQRSYAADATARLLAGDMAPVEPATARLLAGDMAALSEPAEPTTAHLLTDDMATPPEPAAPATARPAAGLPLAAERRAALLAALRELDCRRVVDLGCGEGRLVRDLLAEGRCTAVVGADVSPRLLARAEAAVAPDRLPERVRQRLTLIQTSATYTDARLAGYDAIVLSEVVEHLDVERLPALAAAVFGHARPSHVLVTTPNAEYNVLYPRLPAGARRHPDHRFEWTRPEFAAWAEAVGRDFGYTVRRAGVGPADPERGSPTQLAVFSRREDAHG